MKSMFLVRTIFSVFAQKLYFLHYSNYKEKKKEKEKKKTIIYRLTTIWISTYCYFVLLAGHTIALQPGQRWGEARRRSKKGWMERRRCDAASGVAEAPPGVEPLNQHPSPPSSSIRTRPDMGWKSPVIIPSMFNLWRKVCYCVNSVLTSS